jgi:hypothetical protein
VSQFGSYSPEANERAEPVVMVVLRQQGDLVLLADPVCAGEPGAHDAQEPGRRSVLRGYQRGK